MANGKISSLKRNVEAGKSDDRYVGIASTTTSSLGEFSVEDAQWLKASTAASNVPLYVEAPDVIADLANLLTLSKRS